MNEKTSKLPGWQPQGRPEENDEIKFHRQTVIKIVYGLFYQKRQKLKEMGMPPQPISLNEIWAEFVSRRLMLMSIRQWKYSQHGKRYLDRRVNEAASSKYAEKGIPKIISATAGHYMPNIDGPRSQNSETLEEEEL